MITPQNVQIEKSSINLLKDHGDRIIKKLKDPIQVTLIGKEELAIDTFAYRFALPDPNKVIGH